jgi:hypothetical protein
MGWWNVKPADLQIGDEVRVTTMGGQEFLTVLDLDTGGKTVKAKLSWGSHVPVEPFWDVLPSDETLTVRR